MKRSERLAFVPLALAAIACALLLARGTAARSLPRLELGRARVATVSAATRERLRALEDPVRVTWYRTPPAAMPSSMRGLEDALRSSLSAMRDASNGRFDFALADPGAHPEWSDFLASAGIAPWRARTLEQDGWREARVWSSLGIACGARPLAVWNGLGSEHLDELQALLLAQVDDLEHPRRALAAVDAPPSCTQIRAELARGAELVEVDFEGGAELPLDADLFLWIAPRACGERQLAALDRFLARGGSAIVAGGAFEARASAGQLSFAPTGFDAPRFLAHFGLRALDGLLLDANGPDSSRPDSIGPDSSRPGAIDASDAPAPASIACIAPRQDFRGLRGQPNGTLVFETPSAFQPEPARLAELGLEATVLGRARASAVLADLPQSALAVEELATRAGSPAGEAGLMALLRPNDPWSGSLAVLASSSPLEDARFDDERFAHRALARVLFTNLLSSERRVAGAIARARPEPLRALQPAQRTLWRALVVGSPLLAILLPLAWRARRGRPRWPRMRLAPLARAALVPLVLALPAWIPPGAGLDLTRDGANRFTGEELATLRELARAAPGDGPIALETWFSAPDRLPPELRPLARDARRLCDELARRMNEFEHHAREVGELDAPRERELAALGIEPELASSSDDEATSVRRVVGALRVARGGRSAVVPLARGSDFDALRFRLAFAVQRLGTGRAARVALAAEPPRLTPAEALLEYQKKGLFAPGEGDPFSALAELLGRAGFELERVDPARPAALDAELLVWIQPRRDAAPLMARASELLARGGKALIAGQHFRVLARQLEKSRLDLAFWPEPQFPDLERLYLAPLGIRMPRELVFDRASATLDLPTRVEKPEGGYELVPQPTAQPFLVRAAERSFSADARALRGLGDLLLPSPNRIVWDANELARNGLAVEPWIASSPDAWTFDWEGGDLPADALAGPSASGATGPFALAALVRGRFPRAELVQVDGASELALEPPEPHDAKAPEGELLLVGDSDVWRNERLFDPRFRGDRFALAATAQLALGSELTAFLAHRAVPPAIAELSSGERLTWRALVLGLFPLALVALGLRRRLAP